MDGSLDVIARMAARIAGPMHARFVIQPLMATLLGIRDGMRDARSGPGRPRRLAIPIAVAIVLDVVVQYLLFERVRVLGAVVIGTVLMGLPYTIARGLANRVACLYTERSEDWRDS